MALFNIGSHLYGSMNGNVRTVAIGMADVREAMEKIAAHYYYVDPVTLRHVVRWVHDCGMSFVNNQQRPDEWFIH
jgi:hypothetical protein